MSSNVLSPAVDTVFLTDSNLVLGFSDDVLVLELIWPEALPQCPILNSFSEKRQLNVISFKPEIGPPKVRRRRTESGVLTSVEFRMSTNEVAIFNIFFVTTTPITHINYFWRFVPKEAPRIERMPPTTFRVSFNLVRFGTDRDRSGARFVGAGNLSVNTKQVHQSGARFAGVGNASSDTAGAAGLTAFQDDAFQEDAFQ